MSTGPVPALREVSAQRKSYFQVPWNRRGQVYFLPLQEHFGDRSLGFTGTDPPGCAGPTYIRQPGDRRIKRYPCQNRNVCLYCHERQRRKATLQALHRHYVSQTAVGFSIQLPELWGDYHAVWQARADLLAFLKDHGLNHHTVWVQTYGENPSQGPKPHLDGIVSGEGAYDLCWGEIGQNGGRELRPEVVDAIGLDTWKRGTTPYGRSFTMSPKGRKRMAELAGKARYAGRSTFPTQRFYAGMTRIDDRIVYDLHGWHKGLKRAGTPEAYPNKRTVDGLYHNDDLVRFLSFDTELQSIRKTYHSRAPKLPEGIAELIARQNRWSLRWGFGKEENLVEQLTGRRKRHF